MSTTLERLDKIEQAGEYHLKGYKNSEIARKLDVSPAHAKTLVTEYKDLIKQRVQADPDFLDRLQENTMEMLDALDLLISEAWATYESAKDNEMINQQINLLKVAGELQEKKAKLLQLMGVKIDGGMQSRMQRAEQVNEIVSRVLRDIVGDCNVCRGRAMSALAEAFAMMNKEEEAAQMQLIAAEDDSIIDLDVIEDEEEEDDGEHSDEELIDILTDVVNVE